MKSEERTNTMPHNQRVLSEVKIISIRIMSECENKNERSEMEQRIVGAGNKKKSAVFLFNKEQ